MMDEPLLQFYCKVWEEYRFSSRVLHGICNYLNRHWVKREHDEGHMDVYEVYSVSCLVYKLIFILAGLEELKIMACHIPFSNPFQCVVNKVQFGRVNSLSFFNGESLMICNNVAISIK